MKVKRAAKYGFCSGVRVADIKVKRFARGGGHGAILGQVVHNERVVDEMAGLGVRTVKSMDEVTDGVIVFSAHGVPSSFHQEAAEARPRGSSIPPASSSTTSTTPRRKRGRGAPHLVFIGDPGHREVIGYTLDLDPALYHIVHTVEDAQRRRLAAVRGDHDLLPNDAQRRGVRGRRAQAIESRPTRGRCARGHHLLRHQGESGRGAVAGVRPGGHDLVLVVGGKHSANTRHLHDICARFKPSYLVQGVVNIDPVWLRGAACVGLTAGASIPDYAIDEVEQRCTSFRRFWATQLRSELRAKSRSGELEGAGGVFLNPSRTACHPLLSILSSSLLLEAGSAIEKLRFGAGATDPRTWTARPPRWRRSRSPRRD